MKKIKQSKKRYHLLLLLILITIYNLPEISADLTDIMDSARFSFFGGKNLITGYQVQSTRQTNVTLDVTGSAPVMGPIFNESGDTELLAQTVTEDGETAFRLRFNVSDVDGVANLDFSTANITFMRHSGPEGENNVSFNNSCTNVANDTVNNIVTMECTPNIHYWYLADTWNATASIADTDGTITVNSSNFTISSTTAIVLSPGELTFGSLAIGTENSTATNNPIVVNNTANFEFLGSATDTVNITGQDLTDSVGVESIGAPNFTIDIDTGGTPPAECSAATALVNDTTTAITNAVLTAGNRTAGFGNESLFVCLTIVPSGLSAQQYSTNNTAAWTIGTT